MFSGGRKLNKLVINGGKKLSGEIKLQGAKNSILPILSATVLTNGETVIISRQYVPNLKKRLGM